MLNAPHKNDKKFHPNHIVKFEFISLGLGFGLLWVSIKVIVWFYS